MIFEEFLFIRNLNVFIKSGYCTSKIDYFPFNAELIGNGRSHVYFF